MLPFIAGIAFGSLGVIALNNKDKLKESALTGLDKGINRGKVVLKGAKNFAQEKISKQATKSKRSPKRNTRKNSVAPSIDKSE